jgi:hypothetical protein
MQKHCARLAYLDEWCAHVISTDLLRGSSREILRRWFNQARVVRFKSNAAARRAPADASKRCRKSSHPCGVRPPARCSEVTGPNIDPLLVENVLLLRNQVQLIFGMHF